MSSNQSPTPKNPKTPLAQFLEFYQKEMKAHPIRTQAITSSLLSFTGNVVAQKLIQRVPLNLARTARFSLWSFIAAPIFYNWYMLLDRSFKGKKGKNVILAKLLMDQLLFAPIAHSLFYTVMAILEGNPFSIKKTLSEQLLPTLKNSWKLWPAAQLINFSVMPVQFRSLFGSCVAFVWNIILTVLSTKNTAKAIAK